MHTLIPGKVTARVFTGFSPFAFYQAGQIVGFDIDIVAGFAQAHGLELALSPTSVFEDIWHSPGDGTADLAAAGIARFTERLRDDVAWSTPYYEVLRSILINESQLGTLATIADFEGRSIAFVRGSTADLDTRARAPNSAHLLPVENQAEGVAMLQAGAIDGLAMGAPSNSFNRSIDPRFALIDVHAFSQPEGLRFPVAKRNQALLEALNHFIRTAKASGDIARYIDKWDMQNAG